MSNLIASAGTKEDLEKMINEYYFSTNYIITENNDVYNTKKECTLDTVKVEVKKNRWRFVRVQVFRKRNQSDSSHRFMASTHIIVCTEDIFIHELMILFREKRG